MLTLDLNLLAALDVLLEESSVSRAAAKLHLSPSAMSRCLGRIREATGDPILVKAGRGLVPTPRATAMRSRVKACLEEARALLGEPVPSRPEDFERTFVLRADDAAVVLVGPALLDAIAARAPKVSLVFRAEGDEEVDELRDGRVDLDLGVQGPLGPELRTRPLFVDRRVVVSRRCRAKRKRPMSLEAFARAEHVDVSRRGRRRGPIDDVLEEAGLARSVAMVVPNQLAAAALVAQSSAVALLSERFAERAVELLPVAMAEAPAPLAEAVVAMAWHPRFDGDAAHAWLRDEIRAAMALG
ncbi:MAG: LysR family transcriptional regulator [Polyangiaceae bacterium]